jgi:hypothetical protein
MSSPAPKIPSRKKIVILGIMSTMPVAGCVWLALHYLLGLRRLGHDVYYVEAHARTPGMLMDHKADDGSERAAAFLARIMRRFDLGDAWAFHALHSDRRCYGLAESRLLELYRDADLILNLHGGTVPLPEHSRSGRLVYLETDPVELEVQLYHRNEQTARFLEPHVAFFTWGENYGSPDCSVPLPERFPFRPTRPPVIADLWHDGRVCGGETFTTVGNWRQAGRVVYRKEVYHWSKHYEFLKFIELPRRRDQKFELALAGYDERDEQLLRDNGWQVRPAMSFSTDLDLYRDYIRASRGEFTVAKDQNVRLRSGWFSDRSAEYLAAGRPVITQETGFSNVLPTGRGLFGFSTTDEILAAVDNINSDYQKHCVAASELARDCFNYDVVLPRLLDEIGL